MPMFMLISGMLSSKRIELKKVVKSYILPYILFDTLYVLWCFVKEKEAINEFNLFIPVYVYWYILCLAFMRLLVSSKIKNGVIFGICIIVTFIAPQIPEEIWRVLSWGRICLLWFVFSIGLKFAFKHIITLRKLKKISIVFFIVSISVEILILKFGLVDITWATHDYPNNIQEVILKYIFMLCTIGIFVGVISIIPKRCKLLAKWGRNSLLIYLIHPFIIDVIKYILTNVIRIQWNLSFFVVSLLLTAMITSFLSLNILTRVYNQIISLIWNVITLKYVNNLSRDN